MAGGAPDGDARLPFASLGSHPGSGPPRRSLRLHEKRAAVAAAEAGLGGVSPLDLLPLEAWEMVAQSLSSVQDLWALTGSCRVLRPLRTTPELVAWRRLRVEVAKEVHESNLFLRGCKYNAQGLFDAYQGDYYDSDDSDHGCTCGCCFGGGGRDVPSQRFLTACVPYAWACMHQTIKESPALAALLGPDGCAAMETAEDAQARQDLEYYDEDGWCGFIDDVICPRGGWIMRAVTPLERVVGLMAEAGMARALLELPVPVEPQPWHDNDFPLATRRPMQPLGAWLDAHALEFGAPLVVREKCKAMR